MKFRVLPTYMLAVFLGALLAGSSLFVPVELLAQSDDAEISDPIEPVNRGIFWFNEQIDWMLFEPVATFYHENIPQVVRSKVGNFMNNLGAPLDTVANLAQGELTESGTQLLRFLINTTVGLAGIFDVATEWGLLRNQEDFGTTLGTYGVGHGFYLVLPFFGPSSLRDGVGRMGGSFLNPVNLSYLNSEPYGNEVYWTITGVGAVHARSEVLDSIKSAREGTLDFYLASRSAYAQYRAGKVREGAPTEDEFGDELSPDPAD